jgi:hypothetical protein
MQRTWNRNLMDGMGDERAERETTCALVAVRRDAVAHRGRR